LARLLVEIEKNFGLGFSVGDIIIGACLRLFGQVYLALGANSMGHSLAQGFMESRLSFQSSEPLIGFLA